MALGNGQSMRGWCLIHQKIMDEVKAIKEEYMIPDDDFDVYKQVFSLMDMDGSGTIDRVCEPIPCRLFLAAVYFSKPPRIVW